MSFLNVCLIFMLLQPGRASFLAAAQMCFCSLKRKARLKPAKFFIARGEAEGFWPNTPVFAYLLPRRAEDAENFQTRVLGRGERTRNHNPRRCGRFLCTSCSRNPRIPATFV